MSDLSDNFSLDDAFDLPSTDLISDPSDSIYNRSINGTSDTLNQNSGLNSETMRLFFLALGSITILICLTICATVCIYLCLTRRRQFKRQEKKDHQLIPEQSERILSNRLSLTNSISKSFISNGKQHADKKSFPSSNLITSKTSSKPFYYDNLDDIPFIDESRPTSFIDITRV